MQKKSQKERVSTKASILTGLARRGSPRAVPIPVWIDEVDLPHQ